MKNADRYFITECIKGVCAIVLIGIFIALIVAFGNKCAEAEEKEWNNGHCIRCETPYKAIGVWRARIIYECPNCRYIKRR